MSEKETQVKLRLRRHGSAGPNVRNLLEILEADGWELSAIRACEYSAITFTRGGDA